MDSEFSFLGTPAFVDVVEFERVMATLESLTDSQLQNRMAALPSLLADLQGDFDLFDLCNSINY